MGEFETVMQTQDAAGGLNYFRDFYLPRVFREGYENTERMCSVVFITEIFLVNSILSSKNV